MPRMLVTLYCEQRATLEVDAPADADDATLTQLALRALDASGGQEWHTTSGWVEEKRELP